MIPRLIKTKIPHHEVSGWAGHGLAVSLAALLLASSALIAILGTVFLLGRANPLQATKAWTVTALAVFFIALLWQLATIARLTRRHGIFSQTVIKAAFAPLAALSIGSAIVDACLYSSDRFNHDLAGDTHFRLVFAVVGVLTLYATYLSQVALLGKLSGGSFCQSMLRELSVQGETGALLSVAAIGLLQGTSYVTVMGDDYSRYWTIADALAAGYGYPVSTVDQTYQAGGMTAHLVDLPGLPLAMLLSFTLLGHNTFAAMVPTFVGGSIFPFVAYLAFRELTVDRLLSYTLSIMLSLFPLLSFYVLRSAEPDGMFVSFLMALAFLALRCDRHPGGKPAWPALGVIAGLTALTRPEGLLYALGALFFLALSHRGRRAFWWAPGLAVAVLIPFSATMIATFGVPWPTSFSGVVRWESALQNLTGLVQHALPRYSATLAIPQAVLVLTAIAFAGFFAAGSWMLGRRSPQLLFLAILPSINLLMFFLVSPALTRPEQPYDFFRRASYCLPYATIVASYPLAVAFQRLSHRWSSLLATGLLIASSIAVVGYEVKLWAEPEEIYPLRTQILTSGTYVLATDLARSPYELPHLPFEQNGRNIVVSHSFDYVGFRNDLANFYARLDLHGSDRARGYSLASLLVYLVGILYSALTRHRSLFEPMTPVRF